jgi:hypothetical protein
MRIAPISALALLLMTAATHAGTTTIAAKSAPVSLDVPAGWVETKPANNAIKLQVQNQKLDIGVMVIHEEPQAELSLDDYAKRVVDAMADKLTEASHNDWDKVKLDGRDAERCELSGTRNGIQFTYLITVTKSDAGLDQVLGYATKSKFTNTKSAIRSVCDSFKQTKAQPVNTGPITVKGRDGFAELSLPAGWAEGDAPENAGMQLLAVNAKSEAYVEVVGESREDLTWTLAEYGDKIRGNMAKKGTNTSQTDWEAIKVAGFDARQCELHMTLKGMKLGYLITVVQTPGRYYQILAWTLDSRFDANKPSMQKINDGFKETK